MKWARKSTFYGVRHGLSEAAALCFADNSPTASIQSKLFITLLLLAFLSSAFAADTSGSEKEKPASSGLITRIRQQEEAQKSRLDNNPISEVELAQRELDSLNNTVSNAIYLAERTKRAEESDRGVSTSVVIATVLLVGGIFLLGKFKPRIGFLFKVPKEEIAGTTSNSAEEKSFSEFVTAFKVGPGPRSVSVYTPSEFTLNERLKTSEFRSVTVSPLKLFFDGAPKAVAEMRNLIQEITRTPGQAERQKLLVRLYEKVQGLKSVAGLPEVLPVWQLAAALEGLVKQLSDKERNVTPSTLRTVASAVDLLDALSVPGVKSDLLSEPPLRLLAVDDDSLSRHAVSFALKKALNKPDLAENGEAALALVSHIRYDAIFLDVQMPDMNGFEVCSKIHRTELNQATPVVFVTCQSDFDARAKSTLSGGVDLIGKPFLTFEITVKALTLALRGRLKPASDLRAGRASQVKEAFASRAEIVTSLVVEKEPIENRQTESGADLKQSVNPPDAKHKSREERRRARRRIAQLGHSKKNRGHRGKYQQNTSRENGDALNLSSDMVANAFLAHAPANIEMLQERVENIYEATDDGFRQELMVELYLAVHSLTAEASLAKLQTILQLSSAMEAHLRELVEKRADLPISSLAAVVNSLELLHAFCEAKLMTNLTETPIDILIVGADAIARKHLQNAIQLLSSKIQSATTGEALDLTADKHFDAIFFDVPSQSSDTFPTYSRLREHFGNKTPVVVMCSEADSETLVASLDGGDRLLQRSSSAAEIRLAALTFALSTRFGELAPAEESAGDMPVEELTTVEE